MFTYTLTATFDHTAVADEWIAWLRDEHLAEVLAAGALDAEVIRVDSPDQPADQPVRCEVRYHFASRQSFAAYERDHASRLRAEGLKRFPPERGVRYERRTGVQAFVMPE